MTMFNQDHTIRHWFRWFVSWVLVAIASCAVGHLVYVGLLMFSGHPDAVWFSGLRIGLVISGVAMGCGQWYIIRDTIKRAVWWGGATALGRFLGYPVGLALAPVVTRYILSFAGEADLESWLYRNYDLYEMLIMAIGGAVIGSMQWVVLWREVKYAALWIPISIVAWSLGLGAARWAMIHLPVLGGILALGAAEGVVAGLLTGITMILLLRLARKSQPQPTNT